MALSSPTYSIVLTSFRHDWHPLPLLTAAACISFTTIVSSAFVLGDWAWRREKLSERKIIARLLRLILVAVIVKPARKQADPHD